MSSANYHSPTSTGGTSDQGVREQAKQSAGTAAEEGKHVAGVAKDEARQVASEARQQARNLIGEARTQVEDQSRTQLDRLVSNLRTFTDDLEQMAANSGGGTAGDLVRQVAGTARGFTDKLDGREPSELLGEVRRFARRRPGAFLLGAFAAGVVAGRIARGAKDSDGEQPTTAAAAADRTTGTAYAPPKAGRSFGDQEVGATGAATRPSGVPPAAGTFAGSGSSWEDAPTSSAAPLTGDQGRRGTT